MQYRQRVGAAENDVRSLLTWKGRILPVARSKATASQSSTMELTPSFTRLGTIAAMSGYLPVLFSLFRLHPTTRVRPQPRASETDLLALT